MWSPQPCNVDDSGRKNADASAHNCFCALPGKDKSMGLDVEISVRLREGDQQGCAHARTRTDRMMVGGIGWHLATAAEQFRFPERRPIPVPRSFCCCHKMANNGTKLEGQRVLWALQ